VNQFTLFVVHSRRRANLARAQAREAERVRQQARDGVWPTREIAEISVNLLGTEEPGIEEPGP
jgi:hypothetical protein